jgi:hypothetical protein
MLTRLRKKLASFIERRLGIIFRNDLPDPQELLRWVNSFSPEERARLFPQGPEAAGKVQPPKAKPKDHESEGGRLDHQ